MVVLLETSFAVVGGHVIARYRSRCGVRSGADLR